MYLVTERDLWLRDNNKACNQRTDCFLSQNMFKTSDYMPLSFTEL
jgi:hypothetical protein